MLPFEFLVPRCVWQVVHDLLTLDKLVNGSMHDWKQMWCQVAARSQQLRSEVVSYSGVSWNCVYVCMDTLMCMCRYIQRLEVNVHCLPQ